MILFVNDNTGILFIRRVIDTVVEQIYRIVVVTSKMTAKIFRTS